MQINDIVRPYRKSVFFIPLFFLMVGCSYHSQGRKAFEERMDAPPIVSVNALGCNYQIIPEVDELPNTNSFYKIDQGAAEGDTGVCAPPADNEFSTLQYQSERLNLSIRTHNLKMLNTDEGTVTAVADQNLGNSKKICTFSLHGILLTAEQKLASSTIREIVDWTTTH